MAGAQSFDNKKRKADLKSIFDESYSYCCYEDGDPLPDGKGGLQSFKRTPDALYWKRWIDNYGLPIQGTWLDQPRMFLQEIDAARRGEAVRLRERKATKEAADRTLLIGIRDALRGQ